MLHECAGCGYEFDMNLPGVSTRERPYFTHESLGGTDYLCSTTCLHRHLDRVEPTEPRAPGGVSGDA